MDFTFEWDVNGKTRMYHGQGDNKKGVTDKTLGWNTSYQFAYVAKMVRNAFYEAMGKLSKEKGYDGDPQGLEGTLIIDLHAPFSEECQEPLVTARNI